MENKQSKRRWKIPVLLVSAICILLASSFVFQTTAEASVLTYSLQGATFTSPVYNDGTSAGAGIDTSLITDYSITSSSQYVSNDTYDAAVLVSAPGLSITVNQMPDCMYASIDDTTVTLYKLNETVQISLPTSLSLYNICFIPGFYFARYSTSNSRVYSYDGTLVKSIANNVFPVGFYFHESKYFLVYSLSTSMYVMVLDENFNTLNTYLVYSYTSGSYDNFRSCSYGKYIYIGSTSGIYTFDMELFSIVSYTFPGITFATSGLCHDGNFLFVFEKSKNYFWRLDLSSSSSEQINYPVFYSFPSNYGLHAYFCLDSIFVCGRNAGIKLSRSNFYYNDFGIYAANYIQNAKYVNFSVKSSTSVNGGDMVGIKLDYNLPSEYLSTVGAYGLRLTGCTMLASIDDSSAGIPNFGFSPIVVKVNGSAIPRYSTSYDLIGEHNGIYLYSFISSIDFQGYTRITSLEIYLNCYIPEQLSKHSFSLPVSPVELYLDPAGGGGGGGESSDTSSGGGGGTSSDSSSGGTSSEDHPSDMPPEWERNSVEFWFKNQTQDFFLGTYDMWDADTLQVYFGGYAVGSMEPVPTRIRFLKNDVVTEEIRFENLVFQGWSYSSSLSSFEYPTFSGRFVTVPLDSSRRIYLTDYLSNPQLFIADYGAGMLALVNFDSTDSYLTVVNSETLETTITVNNSTVESMIIYGKVMEYSFFTLSEYISWQPYEEGGVYIHANDWSLYDDVYAGLYLHTYITETPPPTVDWWVEYSMELEAERSRLAELESKANQLYGNVSYDPLDDAGFIDAVSSYTGVIATDAADGVFSLIQKMWSANPYFTYFVAITVGVCCCMFYLRKL